jgi:transcriptional regulator with XRE-family HTH domain
MVRNIKIERIKRGLSQLDIALGAGLSSTRISLLERGILEATAVEAKDEAGG